MSDTEARARRLEELLDLAMDAEPSRQEALVTRACADDPGLRDEVLELLALVPRLGDFLEQPAATLLGMRQRLEAEPAAIAEPAPGTVIGAWRLLRIIGRGGMGVVYLAEREEGGFRQVAALKLVRVERHSDELRRRFLAERQILAQLQHPNLSRLIDGGTTPDGEPWFAMEFVEGTPITTWCDARRLDVRARIALFVQVASAVQYAHRNLIVHRDLKPSNILVGGDGTAKLLDFGIAKLLTDASASSPVETATGLWLMTPEYAAPEQLRHEAITTATDVYALGAVLYELLSGHKAHQLDVRTPREVERVICDVEPRRMSDIVQVSVVHPGGAPLVTPVQLARDRAVGSGQLGSILTGDLDTIVAHALHKDPARRYPSVDALLDDLQRYLSGRPVLARGDSTAYRLRKFVRRNAVGVAVGTLLFLLLATGIGTTLWQAGRARQEARKAAETRDFVVGLFRSADPGQSLGDSLTARAIVDRGLQRIDTALAGQPGVQQELLGVLGVTYRELGLPAPADSALRRAVTLAHATFGSQSEEYAARLTDHATVFNAQGDYAAADSALGRALAIRRALHGERSLEVAATLGELANNLEDQGEWERAVALHRQVIAIDRATGDPTRAEIATDLSNLGVALDQLQEYAAADSAYRAALAIDVARLPRDHPQTLTVMGNIGVTQAKLGNAVAAESIARRVLAGRRRVLAQDHPDITYSLTSLATALENQGRLIESEPFHREALAIRRSSLGDNHPLTLEATNNLAVLLVRIGAFDSASVLLQRVVDAWSSLYGADDPRTGTAINNLGVAQTGAGRLAAAETSLRRALAIRRGALGDSATDVGVTRRNLAIVFIRTGRIAEAIGEARTALALLSLHLPEGHARFAEAWTTLGEALLTAGQPRAADSVLTDARRVQLTKLPGYDYRRAETAVLLARAKLAIGEAVAAESLLVAGIRAYRAFPAHRPRARDAAQTLVALYRRQGRQGDIVPYLPLLAGNR